MEFHTTFILLDFWGPTKSLHNKNPSAQKKIKTLEK